MLQVTQYVRSASSELSLPEMLRSSPDILLGVSDQAAAALTDLGINSVFDLASSRIFANSQLLDEAGQDPASILSRYGVAPADILEELPDDLSIAELRSQPIAILEGIGPALAASIGPALDVKTVSDLANWPPRHAAERILTAAFSPEAEEGADRDAPADLLPKSGVYPTERVYYSTLVFDGYDSEPDGLAPLEAAGPIDLTPIANVDAGFSQPGIGALLTFAQSWYVQAVALGQLLHSVSLAPAESTRIAMIDWSRKTSGTQTEDLTET